MVTEVDICNMALGASGTRSTISSLAENSAEGRACTLFYANAREQLFRRADWGFARRSMVLVVAKSLPGTNKTVWDDTLPQPPWLYEYEYPDDCAKVRFIVPQELLGVMSQFPESIIPDWRKLAVPFELSGYDSQAKRHILTNAKDAIGVYTVRLTDVTLWPGDFVQALVLLLASWLAVPLTGDKELAQGNAGFAEKLISDANSSDAREQVEEKQPDADWLLARNMIYPYPNIRGS